MGKQITVEDILKLHPRSDESEDVYAIETEGGIRYLEVCENSDFGLEYELFSEDYNELDGGVIDEYNAETEEAVAHIIFELLEEMEVKGTAIRKLSHEEDGAESVSSFYERVEDAWKEKVKRAKDGIKVKSPAKPKLSGLDLDNMTREELLLFAKAHLSKCIKSPEGYNFTPGFYYDVNQDFDGLMVIDDNNKAFCAGYGSGFENCFKNK